MKQKTIYLVAGESSGDYLGSSLITAIKARYPGRFIFIGIGGCRMMKAGLEESLFPMSDLSIMGLSEAIPHFFHLRRRLLQTVSDIKEKRPDAVVTIDSPGFTFRLASRISNLGCPLVHYVAPSVWAWKERRAKHTAHLFDLLLTLLPFEPPYFEKEGLPSIFCGHPIVESGGDLGEGKRWRLEHNVGEEGKVLCLLPGSRHSEVAYHLPVFEEVVCRLIEKYPSLYIVLPSPEAVFQEVQRVVKHWRAPVYVCSGEGKEKYDIFAASNIALAASGTVSLELSMAGVPSIIVYRFHPVTAFFARRFIKVRFASLINILQNEMIIPEYLQERCAPDILAPALETLLLSGETREKQRKKCYEVLTLLGYGQELSPGERAADAFVNFLDQWQGRHR